MSLRQIATAHPPVFNAYLSVESSHRCHCASHWPLRVFAASDWPQMPRGPGYGTVSVTANFSPNMTTSTARHISGFIVRFETWIIFLPSWHNCIRSMNWMLLRVVSVVWVSRESLSVGDKNYLVSVPPWCEHPSLPSYSNEFLLRPDTRSQGWYSQGMTRNFCAIFAVIFLRPSGDVIIDQWEGF